MGIELILPFLRPIEPLLLDESISEIVGNLDASWWHERDGIMRPKETISFDASKFRTSLEVIANQLDNKLDEDNPLVRAQFPDRSRPAAVIPPVVRPAVALTITKFACRDCTIDELIARGIPTLGGTSLQRKDPTHQLWNGDRQTAQFHYAYKENEYAAT